MLATIVDWAALGKVVVYASPASRAVGAAAFALCVGLVAFGVYVMFTTKS